MDFTHRPLNALLLGLSPDLAGELASNLKPFCSSVLSLAEFASQAVETPSADVVFCAPGTDSVGLIRAAQPSAAIVVVSRHPEVSDWLDSMEAGADDYCAAPFEFAQLQWILQNTRCQAAAAATAA